MSRQILKKIYKPPIRIRAFMRVCKLQKQIMETSYDRKIMNLCIKSVGYNKTCQLNAEKLNIPTRSTRGK